MKLMKYITVCLLTGILSMSCNYLDVVPDQIPTVDDAFSDRYTTEKSLATCYWGLPRTGWNADPAMLGAMEMILNREHLTETGMRYAMQLNSATSGLFNYWGSKEEGGARSLYAGIRDCNTFLDNVEKVADLNRYQKDRLIAEVKTIKAFMHFYLICFYGPICPLRESVPVGESTQGVRTYREKIDDCFEYVIQLLDEAIALDALPSTIDNRGTELGRFVRAVAYTLKAKALVFRASDFFNGNKDYNSFLDHNKEPFFNQTYNAERWKTAAEACLEAVKICEQDGIRLYRKSDYEHVKRMSDTTELVNTLRSSFSERWSVELIWGNTSTNVDDALQQAALAKLSGASINPSGILSVPFSTVELFYSSNGVPIEEDVSWIGTKYNARYSIRTGDEAHKYYIQEGGQTGALNFDREPRFYATLGFDRGKWYGNHHQSTPDDDSQALYPRNLWGEFSSQNAIGNYNATGYWPKKFVSFNSSIQDESRHFYTRYAYPVLRFADLLLLAAEALNETAPDDNAQPDPEVYTYIDMVRERAGLDGVVDSWRNFSNEPGKPLTKKGMREIIRRERKIELACEGHYFWDSHRWKTAITEQNRMVRGWTVTASSPNIYYTPSAVYVQKFIVRDYLAPIPESDLINNPNLIQNPGW
jgi:hypothetical protein